MIDRTVWDDQREFNSLLRQPPTTFEERTALTKEFTLHLISECAELLNASGTWKIHHKANQLEDHARMHCELIDIFKYWMSICQVWNTTPADLMDAYWWKSAAVRQRWAEQWIHQLDRPFVVLDLDNVLCDYVQGFCDWCAVHRPGIVSAETLDRVRASREWLSAETMGLDYQTWAALKHEFRVSGGKRTLPLMPGAKDFVDWCRERHWAVVVLTSRPIDRYPSLYADTVDWVARHHLVVDFIWWGTNKRSKLLEREGTAKTLSHVQFVVDDDPEFVEQYASLKLRTYWLHPAHSVSDVLSAPDQVTVVRSLKTIMEKEDAWSTKTPDTAPTPPTTTSNP